MSKLIVLIGCLTLLGGCTQWPSTASQGGLENVLYARNHMPIWHDTAQNREQLKTSIVQSVQDLEQLAKRGALSCFPALYDKADMQRILLQREFAAGLYVDAYNGLPQMHYDLQSLKLNLSRISDPYTCEGREALVNQDKSHLIKKVN